MTSYSSKKKRTFQKNIIAPFYPEDFCAKNMGDKNGKSGTG
jgi:hypothetical protein